MRAGALKPIADLKPGDVIVCPAGMWIFQRSGGQNRRVLTGGLKGRVVAVGATAGCLDCAALVLVGTRLFELADDASFERLVVGQTMTIEVVDRCGARSRR